MAKFVSLGRNESSNSVMVAIDALGKMYTWGSNYYGCCGQGDPGYISYGVYDFPELLNIKVPTLVGTASNWVDSSSGEYSTIAINSAGELYGFGNPDGCASFALPLGSGGVGNEFYVPTRCAPGMTFKDCAHCYYYTLAVGSDDYLYVWGDNLDGGMGLNEGYSSYFTPVKHTLLTAKVKHVDCELMCSAAVTVDNKVYVWGDDWWWDNYDDGGNWDFNSFVPLEVTGLPVDADVVDVKVNATGVVALLADGTVWAAGSGDLFLDVDYDSGLSLSNPGGTQTFKQVGVFASRDVKKIFLSAIGDALFFILDENGTVYGFSNNEYVWGIDSDRYYGTDECWNPPAIAGCVNEGDRYFIDVLANGYISAACYIEVPGSLMTCGYQGYGPFLGNDTLYAELAERLELDYTSLGSVTISNVDPIHGNPITPTIPTPPQLAEHVPCGNWVGDSSGSPVWDFTEQYNIIPPPHLPCGHWHKVGGTVAPPTELRIPTGPWKAAMEHVGTPYIYVYDIHINEVVKINTALNPPAIVDRLQLVDAYLGWPSMAVSKTITYDYFHDGGGLPGAQTGSYCIDKACQRLWYFLGDRRDPASDSPWDWILYEVDISDPEVPMRVVKSTVFPELVSTDSIFWLSYYIITGCSNGTYTFWGTREPGGRIIKIRNSDHVIVDDHYFGYESLSEWDAGLRYPRQLDVNVRTNTLYWIYEDSPPGENTWAHLVSADLSFNEIENVHQGGTGFSSEDWNSLLRIAPNGDVVRVRNYWPSHTHQYVYDFEWTELVHHTAPNTDPDGMDYVINILGFEGDYVYFLTHANSVYLWSFLRKMHMGTGVVESSDTVKIYTGHVYAVDEGYLGYGMSGTGIYNSNSKRFMLFTWHNEYPNGGGYKPELMQHNWGATFDADFNNLYYNEMKVTRYSYTPGSGTGPDAVCNPIWPFTKDNNL